jgi:hypothetical protein
VLTILFLYLLGFRLRQPSATLSAAIFTVIISSTAVFFTAFTRNDELVAAVKRKGYFGKMLAYFAAPVGTSLLGLIFAILGVYLRPPDWLKSNLLLDGYSYLLLFLTIYAALGFLFMTVYVFVLLAGTSVVEDGTN